MTMKSPELVAKHDRAPGRSALLCLGVLGAIAAAVGIRSESRRIAQPPRNDWIRLRWQDFSEAKLNLLKAEGKTILVCVTARWGCGGIPHFHENTLNRASTWLLLDELGAVPLLADYTDSPPEIQRWMTKYNTRSVPLTVIYPGQHPEQPIILDDLYDQATILEKLREAGPSVGVEK